MIKYLSGLLGGSALMILAIPLIVILAIGGLIGSVIGAILRFLGIIPDLPDEVPADIQEQLKNAPGVTSLNIPITYMTIYQLAEKQTNVSWMLVAAVHKTTTDCGRNMPTMNGKYLKDTPISNHHQSPNPVGQMNFTQTFWAGQNWSHDKNGRIDQDKFDLTSLSNIQTGGGWGIDANNDKRADPEDPDDGIITMANFLLQKGAKVGATDDVLMQAVAAFNPDPTFLQQVMTNYHQLLADPSLNKSGNSEDSLPSPNSSVADGFTESKGPLPWPASFTNQVSKPYGYHQGQYNAGIDFDAPGIQGKSVISIANGKVLFAGVKTGYGNVVVIHVGYGITMVYSGLEKVSMKTGDIVKQGQEVGVIGPNGLHFEVRVKGAPVDPMPYIKQGLQPVIVPPPNQSIPPDKIPGDGNFSGEQKRRAEQLTSIFENGITQLQYGYCEDLDDGRGFTCGRAGFTTRDGDAYEVVKRYTEIAPGNLLAKYLPVLKKLNDQGSDDTSDLSGYDTEWKKLGNDNAFRSAQDHVVDQTYYLPAMKRAQDIGVTTALGKAIFYDSIIQHGEGDDPDGFPALIERTTQRMGGKTPKTGADEKEWIATFLDVRREDLAHSYEPSTREEWADSVGRVDTLKQLVTMGNWDLKGPFTVHWEGGSYRIP